jgi:hypothetical protein
MALAAAAVASRARMQRRNEPGIQVIEMGSLIFPQAAEILCDIILEQMMVDGYAFIQNCP